MDQATNASATGEVIYTYTPGVPEPSHPRHFRFRHHWTARLRLAAEAGGLGPNVGQQGKFLLDTRRADSRSALRAFWHQTISKARFSEIFAIGRQTENYKVFLAGALPRSSKLDTMRLVGKVFLAKVD